MRFFRKAAVFGFLGAALVLAGCTSPTASKSQENLQNNIDLSNIVLPFDSYQLSDSQLARMGTEWGKLMTRCAADYGATISYTSDYTLGYVGNVWGGPFGTMSKAHAEKYGYLAGPGDPTQPAAGFYLKNPNNIVEAEESTPLEDVISYGRPANKKDPNYSIPLPNSKTTGKPLPDGGCQAIVQAQIGKPLVSDMDLISSMIDSAWGYSQTRAAVSNWSTCMKAAGYSFATPIKAAQSVGWSSVTAEEVKQAVNDVDCTASSRWASVFYTKLIADENAAIPKNTELLQETLASQQRVLKKLDELVGQ